MKAQRVNVRDQQRIDARTCTRADRSGTETEKWEWGWKRDGRKWWRYSEDSPRGQVRCCAAGGRPQRRAGSEQVTGSSAPSSAVPRHDHSRSARWTPLAIPFGFASYLNSRWLTWLLLIANILVPMCDIILLEYGRANHILSYRSFNL